MLNIGVVKWFDNLKGYGFIEHFPVDVYVHFSSIQAHGYRALEAGQKVSYQIGRGKKGPMAFNVKKIY